MSVSLLKIIEEMIKDALQFFEDKLGKKEIIYNSLGGIEKITFTKFTSEGKKILSELRLYQKKIQLEIFEFTICYGKCRKVLKCCLYYNFFGKEGNSGKIPEKYNSLQEGFNEIAKISKEFSI